MNRKVPVDLPEGYVDFFKQLESWQNEKQIRLKNECEFKKYDVLALLAANMKPLLRQKPFHLPISLYQELFTELCSFVSQYRPDTAKFMESLISNSEQLISEQIVQEVLAEESSYLLEKSSELDVPEGLLVFTLDHALRPFLRLFASLYQQELTQDEFQNWQFPAICPICASKSHFSRLRAQDGRRIMFCDRCFSEWEARYLQCVHCGNDEPTSIKYLSIENDDAYRLYTCEKCKGYLKTFDERSSGRNIDLFIANVETIYLDILAQEKGYTNHD